MACYHPMIARPTGFRTSSGKVEYKITCSYDGVKRFDEKVLPCGQCIGCRLAYSKEWANRMMMELEYHKENYFLTLTYDEEHVPRSYFHSDDDGVVDEDFESLTLRPKDLQDFIKRVRSEQKYYFGESNFRYYACGEYGSQSFRPHYHMIVYDLHLPDLEPFGASELGMKYYRSHVLDKLWPHGYVGVAQVSWETCAYVARYIMKKQKGQNAHFYDDFNIVPEFTRMSLKPAIGKQWFLDHKDEIYKNDEIFLSTAKRGLKLKPPHYFDRLYDIEYPEQMSMVRSGREKVANMAVKAKLAGWHGSYIDLLAAEEAAMRNKANKLRRSLK